MDETKPVQLPLPPEVSRCLGHWNYVGEWCAERSHCARHETISHLHEPWDETKPPMYRGCSSTEYLMKLEMAK